MAEYFFPLVYLLIGVCFGELSLKVQQNNVKENAPTVKLITYFFCVVTWPMLVVFAVLAAFKGEGS